MSSTSTQGITYISTDFRVVPSNFSFSSRLNSPSRYIPIQSHLPPIMIINCLRHHTPSPLKPCNIASDPLPLLTITPNPTQAITIMTRLPAPSWFHDFETIYFPNKISSHIAVIHLLHFIRDSLVTESFLAVATFGRNCHDGRLVV